MGGEDVRNYAKKQFIGIRMIAGGSRTTFFLLIRIFFLQ